MTGAAQERNGSVAARQAWLGVLARAPLAELEAAWARLGEAPGYTLLRQPEVGLALVQGRAGGTGQRFNLGEMTVTRCAVRDEGGHLGVGYVAGRSPRHAELTAALDALLQEPAWHERVEAAVLAPLREAAAQRRAETDAETATTRVDFFTLVRGEP